MNYFSQIAANLVLFVVMAAGTVVSAAYLTQSGQFAFTFANAAWLAATFLIGGLSVLLAKEVVSDVKAQMSERQGAEFSVV